MNEGERGEGGASNELRTAMAGMEVVGEDMAEREEAEVKHDVSEAEEGGLGGGCWHWKLQGS